jgi:hypothetical protein
MTDPMSLPHVMSGEYWWVICLEFTACDEWWILVGDLPWVYHVWWVVNIGEWSALNLPRVMSGEYWWAICHEFTMCDEWWILVGNLPWVYYVWWVVNIGEWSVMRQQITHHMWETHDRSPTNIHHSSYVGNSWQITHNILVMSSEYGGWSVVSVPHVMSGEYWWAICRGFPMTMMIHQTSD